MDTVEAKGVTGTLKLAYRTRWMLPLIALVALALVFLAACGSTDDDVLDASELNSGKLIPAETTPYDDEDGNELAIVPFGEPFEVNEWTITVTGFDMTMPAWHSDGGGARERLPGMRYGVVSFTAEHGDNELLQLETAADFELLVNGVSTDEYGEGACSLYQSVTDGPPQDVLRRREVDVAPGTPVEMAVCRVVPETASDVALVVDPWSEPFTEGPPSIVAAISA